MSKFQAYFVSVLLLGSTLALLPLIKRVAEPKAVYSLEEYSLEKEIRPLANKRGELCIFGGKTCEPDVFLEP